MDRIHGIFTKKPYNPASFLIRVANPVSFIHIGPASHVIAVDGTTGYGFEASALHGVRRALLKDMLKGCFVVEEKGYDVPNAKAGLDWLRETAERKAKYDFKGALALGLSPERNWQEDTDWFCFEYFAYGLEKAGRKTFSNNARVSAYMLMSLSGEISPQP
jgi:hypothetical protein